MMRRPALLLALAALIPARAHAWEYLNAEHPVWCDVPRIRLLAPGSDDLGAELSAQEVQRALDAWGAPECSTFRYEYLGTTSDIGGRYDYDSLIYWDDSEWTGDAVGITNVNQSPATDGGNACIRSADIRLRAADRTWTTDGDAAGGTVLYTFNVLAHEVGHLLGLGHSTDTNALMYAYGRAAPTELNDDDRAGVCTLYGAAGSVQDCRVEGCPNDMFCREGLCLSAGTRCGGSITCGANQACIALNDFSYCLDACDFRVSATCAHPDRFCSPRVGDGTFGYCMPGKPGDVADGAPCGEDYECASGMCEEGSCRTACTDLGDCSEDTHCTSTGELGVCLPDLQFGDPCSSSSSCASDLCLDVGDTGQRYCSMGCDEEHPCPEGASCEEAVCLLAPLEPPGSDGDMEPDEMDGSAASEDGDADVPPSDGASDGDGADAGQEPGEMPDLPAAEPPDEPDGILGSKSAGGGCNLGETRGHGGLFGALLAFAAWRRRRSPRHLT